jgi:DNA-binding NtrC family response regulator
MKIKKDTQIFIVDDDPVWTAILTNMLNDLGCSNILAYCNGNDCINNLTHNPKLIFLDFQMEDINGLDVLQKIKKYNAEIGVLFCTAQEDLSVAIDAMKYGSFDFILKTNTTKQKIASIIENMADKQIFADRVF